MIIFLVNEILVQTCTSLSIIKFICLRLFCTMRCADWGRRHRRLGPKGQGQKARNKKLAHRMLSQQTNWLFGRRFFLAAVILWYHPLARLHWPSHLQKRTSHSRRSRRSPSQSYQSQPGFPISTTLSLITCKWGNTINTSNIDINTINPIPPGIALCQVRVSLRGGVDGELVCIRIPLLDKLTLRSNSLELTNLLPP